MMYILTTYRYWQHYIPTKKKQLTEEDKETLIWHDGTYCTYALEEEIVFTLETEEKRIAEAMRKKAEEWRSDYMITAMTLCIQEDGKPDQVQHYQYKRSAAIHEKYGGLVKQQSRARSWEMVEQIDTSREVIHYANTGRDS